MRGTGAPRAEAFAGAATALTSVICDPASVDAMPTARIECDGPDNQFVLLDRLNALVHEMATRHLLFSYLAVRIAGHRLTATAWGWPPDGARHELAAEQTCPAFPASKSVPA